MPICSLQDCLNLQTDLSRLSDWCSTWNLPLNEEKCSVIHFKPRSSPSSFNYHLNGKQISSIAAHKDLGLFVSADLTWRSHYHLLPLMMEFEIVDIMFLVKSVKFPSGHFNIHEFVQFCSYSIY